MTHCIDTSWTGAAPRRSLVGRRAPERRPPHNIEFKTKREAELWGAIYAHQSCHPFHRWEVEQAGAIFSVAIYDATSGKFSHWAEP